MDRSIELLRQAITDVSQQRKQVLPLCRVLDEQELMFLLGAIAQEVSFVLSEGSGTLPYCVLEVDGDEEVGQIRAKVGYRSSRVIHSTSACDAIICWQNDVGAMTDVPIIELQPLFPDLHVAVDHLGIRHEDRDSELRDIFYTIQDWLVTRSLIPSGAEPATETNTATFKVATHFGPRSLCSLQYYDERRHVQFKWFKDTLELLELTEIFLSRYTIIMNRIGRSEFKDETEKEFRMNFMSQDAWLLPSILEQLSAVLEAGNYEFA